MPLALAIRSGAGTSDRVIGAPAKRIDARGAGASLLVETMDSGMKANRPLPCDDIAVDRLAKATNRLVWPAIRKCVGIAELTTVIIRDPHRSIRSAE